MHDTMMFKDALEQAERNVYIKAYRYTSFNQSQTARLLGVSRTTLINKLTKWGELVRSYA